MSQPCTSQTALGLDWVNDIYLLPELLNEKVYLIYPTAMHQVAFEEH